MNSRDGVAGEWVEVLSKEEILRTLDKKGQLDGMPFMPEMFEFCGRRMRVFKSAHKTCDTISGTGGRSVPGAIHLEDARCDGGGHDGCAAKCMLFWRKEWLKPADGPAAAAPASGGTGCTEADVVAAARTTGADGSPTYMCQATELVRFSSLLKWWDFRQYLQDYRTRNVGVGALVTGFIYATVARAIRATQQRPRVQNVLIAIYDRFQAIWGGVPFPRKVGTIPVGQKTPPCVLDLQPGELVRVRPHKDILQTLDGNNKNRGLYFDAEHVPYCEREFKVLARVPKLIDEKNGKMLEMKTASIILDGVTCQAHYSDRRMFCPRAIYPYWREIWLERVNDTAAASAPPPARVALPLIPGGDGARPQAATATAASPLSKT